MLQPIMHILNTQKIILASGSPRRKEILQNIGLKFDVIPSTFEENLAKSEFSCPSDYVMENARLKTLSVAENISHQQIIPDLIIGADTVVALDNKIYEKPKDNNDAFNMLSKFSGRSHTVYTGIVFITPISLTATGATTDDGKFRINQFFESTEVIMTHMSPEVINSYISTGEPMDKAGGYGIQAIGGTLVEAIKGDYFNVMGFPLHRFSKELYRLHSSNIQNKS